MKKYYTNAKRDVRGDILLFEMYDSLRLFPGQHYIAYVYSEAEVREDFIFKYTARDNIERLIEL